MGTLIIDFVIVIGAVIFTAAFPKYFQHIYRTGKENIIKSFSWGIGGSIGVLIVLKVATAMMKLDTSGVNTGSAKLIVLVPILAIPFATGSALIIGLTGLNGAGLFTVLAMGALYTFADLFVPFIASVLFKGIFLYGLGAAILSFSTDTEKAPAQGGEGLFPGSLPEAGEQKRTRLKMDITPISPSDKFPGQQ